MAVTAVVFDVGETLIDETGMWERASTWRVSLPRISPPIAPRPCDAITMVPQRAFRAARKMPCHGCGSDTTRVAQRTRALRATSCTLPSALRAAFSMYLL